MIAYPDKQSMGSMIMRNPKPYRKPIRGAHYSGSTSNPGPNGVDPFSGPSLRQRTTPNNFGRNPAVPQQSLMDGSPVPGFSSINLPSAPSPMGISEQNQPQDPFLTNPFLKNNPFSPFSRNPAARPGPPDPLKMSFQQLS